MTLRRVGVSRVRMSARTSASPRCARSDLLILLPGASRPLWESGGFLLPGTPRPLESASVARCGPNRAFVQCNLAVRTLLRGNRERLVIVGTCVMGRLGGSVPGKGAAFQHTSILVRPLKERPEGRFWWSRRVLPPGPLCL